MSDGDAARCAFRTVKWSERRRGTLFLLSSPLAYILILFDPPKRMNVDEHERHRGVKNLCASEDREKEVFLGIIVPQIVKIFPVYTRNSPATVAKLYIRTHRRRGK